ncbi:MAG: hypothetical protein KJ737_13250 [Proteobacteria bacterium]|nr:hypothetical protein [Pseudomonadota bacterium]
MSDFLHTIRNNSMDKKFHKPRRNYHENNSFPTLEKRTGSDRRTRSYKKPNAQISETLESIKNLLEDISENQQQTIYAQERKVSAIEKKAAVLGQMASFLEKMTSGISRDASTFPSYVVTQPVESSNFKISTSKKPNASDRKMMLEIIEKMRNEGETYHTIAQFLAKEEFPTFSGKGEWHAQTVHRLCQRIESMSLTE